MEFIKDILSKAREKDMGLFNGTMGKSLREIGKKVLSKVLEYGDHQKAIIMKVSGITTGSKGRVYLGIKTALIKGSL